MKKYISAFAMLMFALNIRAQAPPMPPNTFQIVSNGPNEQVWQALTLVTNSTGQVSKRVRSYEAIATGLNHYQNGEWIQSSDQVSALDDGTAAATNGQHQTYYPGDIYEGNIRLAMPDGRQLQSQPLALSYDDGSNLVLIAVLTNSVGGLDGANKVIYADAFCGLNADILYTYRRDGLEQDIILRQQPPDPASLGLNPATTRLQVLTEFIDAPTPIISTALLPVQGGGSIADQTLNFGQMQMVAGRAFLTGDEPNNIFSFVPVCKQWVQLDGRQFLVEEVPLTALANSLSTLPLFSSVDPKSYRHMASNQRHFPARHWARTIGPKHVLKTADKASSSHGLVLDYNIVLSYSTDNDFRGDTTYYVSGDLWLFGTTRIEGGAVFKLDPTNFIADLKVCGPLRCLTEPYRPAILTMKDDDSVGEIIAGSTGNPTTATNYSTGIFYNYDAEPFDLHDLQVRYLWSGVVDSVITKSMAWTNVLRNAEFYSTLQPIVASAGTFGATNRMDLRNVLIENAVAAFQEYGGEIFSAENATILNVRFLLMTEGSPSVLFLTNSLVVGVTNWNYSTGTNLVIKGDSCGIIQCPNPNNNGCCFAGVNHITFTHCLTNSSMAGVFQFAGAGGFYLATNSPYHNAGSTNIDPVLLSDLSQKTTWPPVVCTNVGITVPTAFTTPVPRDTNSSPDLGFHYDPLDYCMGQFSVNGTQMTVSNGVIIGTCSANGVRLINGGQLLSYGTPLAPNLFVNSACVQETPFRGTNSIMADATGTASAVFRFTKFAGLAKTGYNLYDDSGSAFAGLDVRNCEFWSGANDLSGANTNGSAVLVNNLFWRSSLYASNTSAQAILRLTNNLFWGTVVTLQQLSSGGWAAFNNNFDSTSVTGTLTNGYNAYLNTSGRLFPTNLNNYASSNSLAYQSGPLGDFYLPQSNPLINAGNTSANLLGLYQFTTQTNQMKETNSLVDIGYHYVSTDSNGNPLDSNLDGISDYLEDSNGDGLVDNGETNWALAILVQPVGTTVPTGFNATFSVAAVGIAPLHYQWYFNATNVLAGATTISLTVTNVQNINVGSYSVVVTNYAGSITSSLAMLQLPISVQFSNFCDASLLQTNGSAVSTVTADGCVLELTHAAEGQGGSAFLKTPVSLANNASFSTSFSFRLSNGGGANADGDGHLGADGFVFVVQTITNNVGVSGGGIGYQGITNSIGIEFDTWYNTEIGINDPQLPTGQTNANGTTGDGNHVALDLNGALTHTTYAHIQDDMNNSNVWYAWIDYDGTNKLEVRLSETNSRPTIPTITNLLNLISYLHTSNSYVGFTAATGGAYNQQDILSWQFVSPYNPIGSGIPPSVSILSPTNETFIARTNVTITAFTTNSVPPYTVSYVQFFIGTNSLGFAASTNGIYQIPWFPSSAGTDVITALAVLSNGLSAWSAPVTNFVKNLPTVQITLPANGQIFPEAPTNLLIQATVATNWGTLTNISFYQGTNVWAPTNSGSPYTFTWTNVPSGTFLLSARVTNNYGLVAISSNIFITVEPPNQPPSVYAGPNQTNYLLNAVPLNGFISDDGLPVGSSLTSLWTNLNGGTNVTFINSNLPTTYAHFWTTGVYTLQLSASDTQYRVNSNVTFTILSANLSPFLSATPTQTVILPALAVKNPLLPTLALKLVKALDSVASAIDYLPASNGLVFTVNTSGGNPCNYEYLFANGVTSRFSSLSNAISLPSLATVRDTTGGFKVGETFADSGTDGTILRIEPDGSTVGTNAYLDSASHLQTNAWVSIASQVLVTNLHGSGVGLAQGGLWVDRTGIWGGDLIVSTVVNENNDNEGYVFRINNLGKATLVTKLEYGGSYAGVTTIPNDVNKYGPWAGCILVGSDSSARPIVAISTNGSVVPYYLGIGSQAIRVIPENEDFYGLIHDTDGRFNREGSSYILGISAEQFSGMVGDILMCPKFNAWHAGAWGDELDRVHWNGTNFDIFQLAKIKDILNLTAPEWDSATFVPINLIDSTPMGILKLDGCVKDDGEILPATSNLWTVLSGPASVTFSDPALTNTLVEFSVATNYIFQLSAYDGQYTSTTNVTVHVIRNQPPAVSGLNQIITSSNAILTATVTDDGWPTNQVNVMWSQLSGSPALFSPVAGTVLSTNLGNFAASTAVTLPSPGVYVFLLTADDCQATNFGEVTVTYGAAGLVLSPGYGIATGTNVPFTLKASLINTNGQPITNRLITFNVSGANPTNWTGTNDVNGNLFFTYYSTNALVSRDTNTASYGGTNISLPIYKDWASNVYCGEVLIGQDTRVGGATSREWTNNPATYYSYYGTSGDVLHMTLVQEDGPMGLVVRNPADQIVASAGAQYLRPGTPVSLDLPVTTNGNYIIEITGDVALFDFYLSCDSQTNEMPVMQVLYNGTNVSNGGTVVFPMTAQNSPTNVILEVTNAGNGPLRIFSYETNGNFVLTNGSWGSFLTVDPGHTTNFGVAFGAVTSGINFGDLEIATNTFGSNYIVHFQATTYQTNAAPSVQLVSPINGATILDFPPIQFTALAMPGIAPIDTVSLQFVNSNGIAPIPAGLRTLTGNYYSTNVALQDGDYAITAVAVDVNGQANVAPPILVHVVPYVNPSPVGTPGMQVWLAGTNLPSGSTAEFPHTLPNQPTNVTFVVTNPGTYVLWITNYDVEGDFDVSTNVLGPVMAGTATNFTVTFYADGSGTAFGELVLGNNALQGGNYVLNLVGNAARYDYVPPSTNTQPPVASDDAFRVQANSMNNILNPLANDFDTNLYPLKIQSVTPSEGGRVVIINNGTAISYTPPLGIRSETSDGVALPADGFHYTISDGHGGTSVATISIIIDASDVPVVTILNPTNSPTVDPGTVIPIIASVVPATNVVKVDFYLDGSLIGELTNNPTGLYSTNWTALFDTDGLQHHFIEVQATDKYGQMGPPADAQLQVTTHGLTGNLAASLYSMVDAKGTTLLNASNNIIRDGLFQLYGQACHSLGSNVVWQLSIYTPDGTLVRNLTPLMTNYVGSSSVASNLLSCDLTTLMNGVYSLTLSVSGGYQLTSFSVPVRLESNLKIGQFGFSQQDLVIPVSGIPLTVTRTYNSINPTKGDFGYGWTYALNSMAISLDETREDVVDLDGNVFSERSGGSWDVTLTLPNGQTTTFYFCITNGQSLGTYQAQWFAAPGVTATLTGQGMLGIETLLSSVSGNPDLVYWDATGLSTPWDKYDFPGFVLKTLDGTQYIINRDDLEDHFVLTAAGGYYVHAYGQPYLSAIIDRNTNTITINPNSISVKTFSGATNQITFQRNADGLITSISDPNGLVGGSNGPPAVKYEYDNTDNLIAVLNLVDRTGTGAYVTNSFVYTNNGFPHYITGIINADGTQVAKNFYDDTGKLVAVQDADGKLTKFIHNLTNNMDVIIDRRDCTNTYVYDPRGNVIAQTNQLGQISLMAYDGNNNKTNEVTFLNGQPYATSSYVYDTNNLLQGSTDPLGHTNGFVYDNFGNVTRSADAMGTPTVNAYDASGNLLSTTDALNHGTTNFYGGGQILGSVDAVGTMTTNYYNPSTSYLIGTATMDISHVVLSSNTFAYDQDGNRTTSTVWRRVGGIWIGATTAYVYDGMNRVVHTINPDGGTNTVVYDNIGKQQSTTDPLGHVTGYGYDLQGRLVVTTNADFTTEKSVYDANGNRTQSIDRTGRITAYFYDALNRLTNTIYADGASSTTVYDDVGRLAQTLDARGTITGFAYDMAGRRLAVTNAFGTSIAMTNYYAYDANGNQLTLTDSLGRTTTRVFDVLNRQWKTLYPDNTSNSIAYDAVGRRVATTNQDGVVTGFGYDGAGRLVYVTNALNAVTSYQYDEAGNEIAQIDALNHINTFDYDGMGRRVGHTKADLSAGNQSEVFAYDLEGNLIAHTNFFSTVSVIFYAYDEMNRLTNRFSIPSDNGDVNDNYSYTATGMRESMSTLDHLNVIYAYDDRDRLTQKIVQWGSGPTGVLNYQYDLNGNIISISSGYGNGAQLAYNYDALNRLTNVLSHGQAAAAYGYDLAGNLQGVSYGNGVTNLYQYDSLNRLTGLVWNDAGGSRASFIYQLKAGGTRTNAAEFVNYVSAPISHTCQWSYDSLYRLTNELVGVANAGYQYDTVGNRLNRTTGGTPLLPPDTYSYDPNDQLITTTNNTFDYDGDGNNNGIHGGNAVTYDYLNRAHHVAIGVDPAAILIHYDGDENRIFKQVGNVSTYYLVDDRNPSGYAQVLEEYKTDSALSSAPVVLSRVYNYGLNLISQQQFTTNTLQPSTLSYYGYDGHGNVRFLMSTNGTITDTYTYDAFGTLIASNGVTPNNYLYCGQQFDPDLGLYYNRARYLNTDTGRFWSSDSYQGNNEEPLSLHKYLYVKDNPVDMTDPSGQDGIEDISLDGSLDSFTFGGIGARVERLANVVAGNPIVVENVTEKQKILLGDGSYVDVVNYSQHPNGGHTAYDTVGATLKLAPFMDESGGYTYKWRQFYSDDDPMKPHNHFLDHLPGEYWYHSFNTDSEGAPLASPNAYGFVDRPNVSFMTTAATPKITYHFETELVRLSHDGQGVGTIVLTVKWGFWITSDQNGLL